MKCLRYIVKIVVIAGFLAGCNKAPHTELSTLDAAALRGILPNGMNYIILENDLPSGKAELRLVVKSGSLHDLSGLEGVAHFVEHMQFQGTSRYKSQEIVRFFESIGMAFGPEVNAYTSYTNTQYTLTIPSDIPSVFRQAIDILDDWARGPELDFVLLEKERKVIVEEIHNYDTVQGRFQFAKSENIMEGTAFKGHFPTGTRDSVMAITAEDLTDYVQKWYHPSLMTLIVVGDFHKEKIEILLRDTFVSDYDRGTAPKKEKRAKLKPVHTDTWFEYVDSDLTNDRYSWWNIEDKLPSKLEHAQRLDVCAEIALKAVNERLSELSRDTESGILEGAVYWIQNTANSREIYSTLVPRNGAHEKALNSFVLELKRAEEHGLTPTEYERGVQEIKDKAAVKLNEWMNTFSINKTNAIALDLMEGIPYPYGETFYNSFQVASQKICKKDVDRWLDRYLFPSPAKTIACFKNNEALEIVQQKQTQEIIAHYKKARTKVTAEREKKDLLSVPPNPGTIVSKESIPGTPFMKWTLSNGLTIYCYRNKLTIDDFRLQAFSSGGLSLVDDTEYWNAAYAMQILGNN